MARHRNSARLLRSGQDNNGRSRPRLRDCAELVHGVLIVRKIQDDRSNFVWTFGKRAQCLLLGRGVHEFTPATGRGMLNRQVALGIVDSNDKEGFHVRRLRREEILLRVPVEFDPVFNFVFCYHI
jgi:hypothetical protein